MRTTLTGLVTFGVCHAARWYLDRKDRKEETFAGGRLKLTTLWNEKGAFGLPMSKEILLSLGGAAMGTLWMLRHKAPVAAGLILGGGLSNFAERLRQGKVYDYVQFPKAPGKLKRYVFNLADFAILTGCVVFALRWNRSE